MGLNGVGTNIKQAQTCDFWNLGLFHKLDFFILKEYTCTPMSPIYLQSNAKRHLFINYQIVSVTKD